MTNMEREHFATLARKAAALQKVWLREREEKRTVLAAANAEIKQRWVELDKASAPISEPAPQKKITSLIAHPGRQSPNESRTEP